jgi:hypothetical protein
VSERHCAKVKPSPTGNYGYRVTFYGGVQQKNLPLSSLLRIGLSLPKSKNVIHIDVTDVVTIIVNGVLRGSESSSYKTIHQINKRHFAFL